MSDTPTTTVTLDDFTARLTALHAAGKVIADSRGWCSGWYHHFARLTKAYRPVTNEHGDIIDVTVDITALNVIHIPAEYLTDTGQAWNATMIQQTLAAELELISGRIRRFGQRGEILVGEVNQALTALGMPEVTEIPYNRRFTGPTFALTVDDSLSSMQAIDRVNEAVTKAMEGLGDGFSNVKFLTSSYGERIRPEVSWGNVVQLVLRDDV